MLVLSRKNGECVQIGAGIEVKVLEISGGKVKLGFTAPPNVSIQRNEIRSIYPQSLATWGQPDVGAELCMATV
jgi:carbon storage regulator CsrA